MKDLSIGALTKNNIKNAKWVLYEIITMQCANIYSIRVLEKLAQIQIFSFLLSVLSKYLNPDERIGAIKFQTVWFINNYYKCIFIQGDS